MIVVRNDLQHAAEQLDAVFLFLQVRRFPTPGMAQGVAHELGDVQVVVSPAGNRNVIDKVSP